MTTCKTEMCKKDIYNRKEFLKWAVKGGHPNKGGSTKIFQVLSACADKQIFCDLYTKPRPAKPKTPPKAKPRSPPKPYKPSNKPKAKPKPPSKPPMNFRRPASTPKR